jgi:hypothetical protein
MPYRNILLSFHDYWIWHILTLQNTVTYHVLILKMSAVCFNGLLQNFILLSEYKTIFLPIILSPLLSIFNNGYLLYKLRF